MRGERERERESGIPAGSTHRITAHTLSLRSFLPPRGSNVQESREKRRRDEGNNQQRERERERRKKKENKEKGRPGEIKREREFVEDSRETVGPVEGEENI